MERSLLQPRAGKTHIFRALARAGALIAAILLFGPNPLSAAPLVFDFEDGLQGWELHGSAQRVQTQVLGGEWAIFGDASLPEVPRISLQMDLTVFLTMTVDLLLIADTADSLNVFIDPGSGASSLPPTATIGSGDRLRKVYSLSGLGGTQTVHIGWRGPFVGGCVGGCIPLPPPDFVGFIDNVTFYPIPEPGHLGLVGLIGLTTLLRIRKRGRRWPFSLLLLLVVPTVTDAARLHITLSPIAGGLEAQVDSDFPVETASFGVIFAGPCPACTWQKDSGLSPFTADFGFSFMTEETENSFLVSASSAAWCDFGPCPDPLNPSSPQSFRLGQINFSGPDPRLLRPILVGDPAFDDLLSVVGVLSTDASVLGQRFSFVDFTEPGNVYSVRVIPEPGHLGLLGVVGVMALRRLRRR